MQHNRLQEGEQRGNAPWDNSKQQCNCTSRGSECAAHMRHFCLKWGGQATVHERQYSWRQPVLLDDRSPWEQAANVDACPGFGRCCTVQRSRITQRGWFDRERESRKR